MASRALEAHIVDVHICLSRRVPIPLNMKLALATNTGNNEEDMKVSR
jgi:hypothetical protein